MHRLLVFILVACASAIADTPIRQRAVDVILLDDGIRLLGMVVPNQPNGPAKSKHVQMLCRADWLKENAADLYASILAAKDDAEDSAQQTVTVQSLLEVHISDLQSKDDPNVQRITFLTEEWNAMQPAEGENDPNVVLLSIPEKRIRRKMLKQPTSRQLAGLGILNQIESTETLKPTTLKERLQQIDSSELVRDLPGLQPKAAEATLQRILVYADRMIGKTCRLVFFNGTWLSESAAAENQQAMMMQMMTGGLQSQLQQLLDETAGPKPGSQTQQQLPNVLPAQANALATAENADVVEVRTMQLNPGRGTASVGIALYSRDDQQGPWKKILMVNARADQSDVTADSRQRILQDERVKEVTTMFSQLGINSGQLNSALTMGAIVESASGKAELSLAEQLKPTATASAKIRLLRRTLPKAE